jgi:hypothetical protein
MRTNSTNTMIRFILGRVKMKQKYRLPAILMILAIFISAIFALLIRNGQAAPNELAALPTTTSHYRRTPTITPTRTPLTIALKKQLVFGGMGAGAGENYCTTGLVSRISSYPGIISAGRLDPQWNDISKAQNFVGLCIVGIPFTDEFAIDLYHPNGKMVSHSEFRSTKNYDEDFGWSLEKIVPAKQNKIALGNYLNNIPTISLDLWMPAGAPSGQWYARISAPGMSFNGSFDVPTRPDTPIVNLGKPPVYIFPNADPLGESQGIYTYNFTEPPIQTTGDKLKLYGVGFKPGSVTPIGAYLLSKHPSGNTQADLIGQIQAVANSRGEWSATYTIQPTDPPGEYELIVVLDTKLNAGYEPGPHFAYSTTSWKPCPNTYASRLKPGIQARVIEGQSANRLRNQPTRSGNNQIGRIPAGEAFDILDGPRCADGWVWWYVKTWDGQRGWTAEGDQSERWLEPTD